MMDQGVKAGVFYICEMISESELILNSRGAVYHLDLRPEEIADTIITVGDPDRVERISRHFDKVEVKRHRREFTTHTGLLFGKPLTVISTGIGTDNIDIVITELDALVNIDLEKRERKKEKRKLKFIRIGTSGALRPEIHVDSFVISEFAIGIDNLINFYEMKYSEHERELLGAFVQYVHQSRIQFIPYIAAGSTSLLQQFGIGMIKGVTLTCPGFYGPQGRKIRASLAYPNFIDMLTSFRHEKYLITNFEMETSGIYGLARILGHEAISLSAIIANRIEKKFSRDHEGAVDKLIELVIGKITEQ